MNTPQYDIIQVIGRYFEVVDKGTKYATTREHDSLIVWKASNSFCWFSQSLKGRVLAGDAFDFIGYLKYGQMWESRGDMFLSVLQVLEGTETWSYTPPARKPPPRPLRPSIAERFHNNLGDEGYAYWAQQGINPVYVDLYQLGTNPHKWWAPGLSVRAYTIPVYDSHGNLRDVRHRGIDTGTDKYRPISAGRGANLFNGRFIQGYRGEKPRRLYIVEGEKKSIVADTAGIPAISSTGGCGHWNNQWTRYLPQEVVIVFDPDEAGQQAQEQLAKFIWQQDKERKVYYVEDLPDKLDDCIIKFGADTVREVVSQPTPLVMSIPRMDGGVN